ncbi:hypothetical protein F4860DRAFT_257701 [Xylaria cubensis]|nr:hypothetical protein F4860DRAFT_257701 [Xylaria cubensis]
MAVMEAPMAIQRNHLHGTVRVLWYSYTYRLLLRLLLPCYYYYFYSPSDTVTVAKVARAHSPDPHTRLSSTAYPICWGPPFTYITTLTFMYIDLISTEGHPSYNKEGSPSTPPSPPLTIIYPYRSRVTPLGRKSSINKYSLTSSGAIGLTRNLVHL